MPLIRILHEGTETTVTVERGTNLRRALLESGFTPYTAITRRANCGGRGICATCGVWVEAGEPRPVHWHDWAAHRFGYPRLSCQITVEGDMTVRILAEKILWGSRDGARAGRLAE
jgi:ferredoxin